PRESIWKGSLPRWILEQPPGSILKQEAPSHGGNWTSPRASLRWSVSNWIWEQEGLFSFAGSSKARPGERRAVLSLCGPPSLAWHPRPHFKHLCLPRALVTSALCLQEFQALCTRNKLLAEFGDRLVRLSTANTYSYHKVDVPFQEYVEHLLEPQDLASLGSDTLYFFGDNNFTEWGSLFQKYMPPPFQIPGTSGAYSFGIAGQYHPGNRGGQGEGMGYRGILPRLRWTRQPRSNGLIRHGPSDTISGPFAHRLRFWGSLSLARPGLLGGDLRQEALVSVSP
uniref:Uncharacterized protein n=1 Tax=Gopherus agassizii TaxID=38772 RepID=A0A452H6D2_9SAUR